MLSRRLAGVVERLASVSWTRSNGLPGAVGSAGSCTRKSLSGKLPLLEPVTVKLSGCPTTSWPAVSPPLIDLLPATVLRGGSTTTSAQPVPVAAPRPASLGICPSAQSLTRPAAAPLLSLPCKPSVAVAPETIAGDPSAFVPAKSTVTQAGGLSAGQPASFRSAVFGGGCKGPITCVVPSRQSTVTVASVAPDGNPTRIESASKSSKRLVAVGDGSTIVRCRDRERRRVLGGRQRRHRRGPAGDRDPV